MFERGHVAFCRVRRGGTDEPLGFRRIRRDATEEPLEPIPPANLAPVHAEDPLDGVLAAVPDSDLPEMVQETTPVNPDHGLLKVFLHLAVKTLRRAVLVDAGIAPA